MPEEIVRRSKTEQLRRLMFEACDQKNWESLAIIIGKGADVNATDIQQRTILMYLALAESTDPILKLSCHLVLSYKAKLDMKDSSGMTALMFAAGYRNYDIAELLIENLANVNLHSLNKVSALMFAVRAKSGEIASLLIDNGAKVCSQDSTGMTALAYAAKAQYYPIVELLLSKGAVADLNIPNINGFTPLMWASFNLDTATMLILLNIGADINAQDKDGKTALIHIAENPQGYEAAKLLLTRHLDIDKQDASGSSALIWATYRGNESLVELLLSHRAGVNVQDKEGLTALILAAQMGHTMLVEKLLQRYASTDICDSLGMNALMHSCHKGDLETVILLLENGASVAGQDKNGWTALMHAVHRANIEIIRELISAGADLNIQDNDKMTALMYAVQDQSYAVVKLLLSYPDIEIRLLNRDGDRALDLAIQNSSVVIQDLFDGPILMIEEINSCTSSSDTDEEPNINEIRQDQDIATSMPLLADIASH